ncbi:MAG: hypothetical protein KF787_03830 [Phycisphaeraceae bacterium]|nr:hypothetical protein [Phycisphaerae bacterium]MBX3391758.1 hypothetical protein [Phycisphaeraceae bacterium]
MGVLNYRRAFRLATVGLVAPVLAVVCPADPASARQRVAVNTTMGGPMVGGSSGNQIGSRSIQKYGAILGLTDDQSQTVKSLHEGYLATYRAASGSMQREIDEARQAFEETEDGSVLAEKIPEARARFKQRTALAEREFFSDVRLILTQEQMSQWERVERARRRETILRGGMLSGESVDLVEIVDELAPGSESEELQQAVARYEMDMDRSLLAKQSVIDKQGEFAFRPGALDLADLQKRSAETREAGLRVKGVNQDHARRIEQALPEDVRPAFAAAVKRRSFPRVYRPSQVTRAIDSALAFKDLDAGQRSTLQSLKEAYERDVSSYNDSWASAIEKDEQDPNNLAFGDGGMQVKVAMGSGGDDADTPLAKARKARREFDEATRQRLNAALTPEQRERLPKPGQSGAPGESEDEEVGVGESSGATVIIRR